MAADGFRDDYKDLLAEYVDILEGLGQVPQLDKIEIDASVTPRQQARRRAPVSTREALIRKLKHLEKDGTIQQVNYPTSWVSNFVQVLKKDGSLRKKKKLRPQLPEQSDNPTSLSNADTREPSTSPRPGEGVLLRKKVFTR